MNLIKLFEAQKKLDNRIIEEKGLQGMNFLPQKVLALITELGECANEWRGFKFWSADQEPRDFEWFGKCHVCEGHGVDDENHSCVSCAGTGDGCRNPLLEEYVDCLHFALSLVISTHEHYPKNTTPHVLRTINNEYYFVHAAKECASIITGGRKERALHAQQALQIILGLGQALGFSDSQIEAAYFQKNATNHERQHSGY